MKMNKNLAISENGFLFNPITGESFSVNPIGALIIDLFKEGQSPEQIIKEIKTSYNADESTIEKDLYDFTALLEQYQLTEHEDKE